MNRSTPGPSVHGVSQARILEWVAISFSRGSSWLRDRTRVSWVCCTAGGFFIAEPPVKPPTSYYSVSRFPKSSALESILLSHAFLFCSQHSSPFAGRRGRTIQETLRSSTWQRYCFLSVFQISREGNVTGSAGVSINLVMTTEGVGERLLHGTESLLEVSHWK